MAGGYVHNPKGSEGVAKRIREIERDLDRVRRKITHLGITIDPDTNSLVVTSGRALRVTASDGNTIAVIGNQPGLERADGSPQAGVALYREDGSIAAFLGDSNPTVPPFKQSWQVFDRSGDIVMADDTNSGHGLGVPYIPAGTFGDAAVPSAVTTSATYEELQWADVFQQHPRLMAGILVYTPAGTTGRFRLKMNGTPIAGSEVLIPGNTFTMLYTDPVAWPSFTFGSRQLVVLEAQRDSGTGSVGVRGLGLWGVQS